MKLLALLPNIIFDLLLLLRLVSQTFLAELLIEYSATASQDRVHVPDDARGLRSEMLSGSAQLRRAAKLLAARTMDNSYNYV